MRVAMGCLWGLVIASAAASAGAESAPQAPDREIPPVATAVIGVVFRFATALIDLGLPENSLAVALLAFNMGVEIGQVAFVVQVLALGQAYRVLRVRFPARAEAVPAYTIGGIAAFWTAERIGMMVGAWKDLPFESAQKEGAEEMMKTNSWAEPRLSVSGAFALAAVLALIPQMAFAHDEVAVGAGLVNGLMHPITGPDHLIAMVAVGLWGAQLGAPLIWALPIAFPLVMAIGGILGVAGVPLPAVEVAIAASALVLGLAVLTAYRAPNWLAVLIVSVFAIFHGHAHGTDLPHAATPFAYGLGFVTATGLLHLAGILIGLLNGVKGAGPAIVRGSGGVIAVLGGYFFVTSLGVL